MLQRILTTSSSSTLSALTGLTRREFDRLQVSFARAYQQSEDARRAGQRRRRDPGGGRKGAIPSPAEKLLFILFYVRHYPVQRVQAVLFGLGQAQAWEWVHRLLPVLEGALGHQCALPLRKGATMAEVLAQCPGLEFWIDATERLIPRPQDAERRKTYYSGKKKRHTVKNTVVTPKQGRRVLYLGETVEGKRHDKTTAEDDAPPFPGGSRVGGDSGYQGWEVRGGAVITPMKKPRGGDLTAEEKALNRQLSQMRVRVEHVMAGIKEIRMAHDIFRGRTAGDDDRVMVIAAGFYNYRCEMRDQARRVQQAS
jgi:hypothetical protein